MARRLLRSAERGSASHRLRHAGAIVVGSAMATGALVLGSVAPVLASPPVDLDGAYVLDETGVLNGDIPRIEAALDRLFDAGGAPLFVVVVGEFENAPDGLAWADDTAALSGLGERDALLAIAVDDREYATSVGGEFPATDEQLADAESEALVPALRDDRWADGIIDYADFLTAALTAVDEPIGSPDEPADEPGEPAPPVDAEPIADEGGIPFLPIALGVGGFGAVAWFLVARARRTKNPVTAAVDEQSITELDQTASRRLVQLDDALTTSEQELGFAEAQFGTASTEGFRTALARARTLVAEAFRVRRELDDENTETDEQRRAALLSIIAACDDADELLEAQEDAFDALRDLENDLPAAIAAVTAARAAAPAALDAAEATVQRLRADFDAAAITSVADAPEQARRLLELADAELGEAAERQQAGATSEAAVDVRSAQLALAQLTNATDAVERLSSDLATAGAAVAAQRDDLRSGIAAAQSLPTSPALASALASAESALASADPRNPIAALDRLIVVDRELDTQLAGAREESERRTRAEAALERTLASARSRILAAAEYVASHRGAVGSGARARLAEAQAHEQIAASTRATDPVAALDAAQRALDLAGHALQSAENDVQATMAPSGAVGSLLGGGMTSGGGGGGGLSGALIGGLLGGLLSGGGGGSGGGFGGGWSGGASRPRFGSSGGLSGGGSSRRAPSARSSGRRGGGGRF